MSSVETRTRSASHSVGTPASVIDIGIDGRDRQGAQGSIQASIQSLGRICSSSNPGRSARSLWRFRRARRRTDPDARRLTAIAFAVANVSAVASGSRRPLSDHSLPHEHEHFCHRTVAVYTSVHQVTIAMAISSRTWTSPTATRSLSSARPPLSDLFASGTEPVGQTIQIKASNSRSSA